MLVLQLLRGNGSPGPNAAMVAAAAALGLGPPCTTAGHNFQAPPPPLQLPFPVYGLIPGVNFINILRTAFTLVDPKSVKNTVKS